LYSFCFTDPSTTVFFTLSLHDALPILDPESNFIILEQLAQARDQTTWDALMAPALEQLNCQVIQSTSDEAPGLLAYVEHYLEARSEEHTSELQSRSDLVCRLLLEKKKE